MGVGTILAIIGGGVVLLVFVFIASNSALNRKNSEKLKKTLEKIKKEASQPEEEPKIFISKDEPAPEVKVEKKDKLPSGVIIEDYVEEDKPQSASEPVIEDFSDTNIFELENKNDAKEEKINWEDFSLFDDEDDDESKPKKKKKKKTSKEKQPEDFEQFLDNYSYTRKIIDKDLLKKLNSYPKEIKEIILNNILNKTE